MSSSESKIENNRRYRPWLIQFACVVALGAFFATTRLAPAQPEVEMVSPEAGLTIVLGPTLASIYYQQTAAGFRVVATAATDPSRDVIRFICTLAAGQETSISVPRPVGERAIELRLHRAGDVLELRRPVS
jgi:hypothetical protein